MSIFGNIARKRLAWEIGYTGALDSSAEMKVWRHAEVMRELATSDGPVPDGLKE